MVLVTAQPDTSSPALPVDGPNDLTIEQGKTFSFVLRWESLPLIYKPITGITKAGPAVLTVAGHGAPTGWRAAVVAAGGMRQINAKHWPLWSTDFHPVTSAGADALSFNDVDSEAFTTYTSGGSLVYYTPVDLAGFSARMQVRATVAAADPPLLSLTTAGVAPLTGITLDNTAKTITLLVSATDTAAITWLTGVYDLELESGTGEVTKLLSGNVFVVDEVTR